MLFIVKTLIFLIFFLNTSKLSGAFHHGSIYFAWHELNPNNGQNLKKVLFLGNSTGILPTESEAKTVFDHLNLEIYERILFFNGEWVYQEIAPNVLQRGWMPIDKNIYNDALNWYLEQVKKHFHKHIGFCE